MQSGKKEVIDKNILDNRLFIGDGIHPAAVPSGGRVDISAPATEMLKSASEVPVTFSLSNAHPNPFNAQTTISFGLPQAGDVNLTVYNLAGQKVATLVKDRLEAGYHTVTWDASNYSRGIYFYRLTTGDMVFTKRMALLK
jgi:hypothetical protein